MDWLDDSIGSNVNHHCLRIRHSLLVVTRSAVWLDGIA